MRKTKETLRALSKRAKQTAIKGYIVLRFDTRGSGWVEEALKIAIACVLGALLLGGLYLLFHDQIMPLITSKTTDTFNYGG